MADTLADKLKKQKQLLGGMADPNFVPDPNAPKQGMGDQKVAEQESLAEADQPEEEFAPAEKAPAEDDSSVPTDDSGAPDPGVLAKRLRESDKTINQIQSNANRYSEDRTIPKDRSDQLQAAIQQAKDLYNTEATKNQWLDVAQSLSRAVAQFGAASSNYGSLRDASNLNFGPGIDFNARTEQARRATDSDINNAKDLIATRRQNELDNATQEDKGYGATNKSLEDTLAAQRERERDEDQYRRSIDMENIRAKRYEGMEAKKDAALNQREDDKSRQLQIQDARNELKKQEQELMAARQLANNAISDPDLKSKDRDKLTAQYGALAAKAGIDPSELANISEQSKDKGLFGTGLFRSEDKKKKADLINQQLVQPKMDKIQNLRRAIDELAARRSGQSQVQSNQSSAPVAQPQAAASAVQASGSKEPTPDMVSKYVSANPSVTPDQARAILRKRLNG